MIWVLGILLAIVVSLYLVGPFLARNVAEPQSDELSTYQAELRAIENSEEPQFAKKAILQARLLKAAKAELPFAGSRTATLPILISLGIIGGGMGLYHLIGSPNFTPETHQNPAIPTQNEQIDFQILLPRFEARLADNPNDATGWQLYGRTLMLAGDLPAGLRAYERALELTDTTGIRKEYEAAKTYAANVSGKVPTVPSQDDITAMQALSADDRRARIEGMVEGLRSRLEDDPTDKEGWTRLLRSRKVLGQTDEAKADMEALREALPQDADAVIQAAGW